MLQKSTKLIYCNNIYIKVCGHKYSAIYLTIMKCFRGDFKTSRYVYIFILCIVYLNIVMLF